MGRRTVFLRVLCCGFLGRIYQCLLGVCFLFFSPPPQNQDHYAVLGLGNIRYRATQKQIKAARKYLSFISIPFFQMYTTVSHVKIHTCHEQVFYCFTGPEMPALRFVLLTSLLNSHHSSKSRRPKTREFKNFTEFTSRLSCLCFLSTILRL